MVLSAIEKNASIEGTIMHRVQTVSEEMNSAAKLKREFTMNANSSRTLSLSLNRAYIVVINSLYNVGCVWIVSTGAHAEAASVLPILSSTYFSATASGPDSLKIESKGAAGTVLTIEIGHS